MLLARTIHQLDIGYVPPDRALELGQLGYLQWLGALPGQANYMVEAMRAYEMAQPFQENSPAIAVFCALLVETIATPVTPLTIAVALRRRGGAQARRTVI